MVRTYTSCKESNGACIAYIEVWGEGAVHWYSKPFDSQELRRRWIKDKLVVLELYPPR